MKHTGRSLARLDELARVTGRGRFAADIALSGQLHMRVVRAPVALGRLRQVDTGAAHAVPGVRAIWTAEDLAGIAPAGTRTLPSTLVPYLQPILARETVRFVGEPVAAVFADSAGAADDAAELIVLDIEAMEPSLAISAPAAGLTDQLRSSEAATVRKAFGDLGSAFQSAAHVVNINIELARDGAVPIEPRSIVAAWDPARDVLDVWVAAKVPAAYRDALADALGRTRAAVAVHVPSAAGNGGRDAPSVEDILVARAAHALQRPVHWVEDRRENLLAADQGRGISAKARAAVAANGTLVGLDVDLFLDQGAYVRPCGTLPAELLTAMLPGPYRMKALRAIAHMRITNRPPAGPMRAAGRMEAAFIRERLMDAIAASTGIDPLELRRRNMLERTEMPADRHLTIAGQPVIYDSGNYRDLVDQAGRQVSLDLIRRRAEDRRDKGELVGVGTAVFVDVAGGTASEHVTLTVDRTGAIEAVTAAADLNGGLRTVLAQIIADIVGVDYETVRVTAGETSRIVHPVSGPLVPSDETVITATQFAAEQLRDTILEAAQALLEDPGDRLTIQSGRIRYADRHFGNALSLGDVAAALEPGGELGGRAGRGLVAEGWAEGVGFTFPYGLHVAVVEIDRQTGMIRVPRAFVAVEVGNAINPALMESEIAAGAAEGIANALYTGFEVTETGDPKRISLGDYLMPGVADLPEIEIMLSESAPSPLNPLGIKGAADCGMTGMGAAIAAAVDEALGAPGFVTALPISPAKVMAHIRKAGKAR
ncbi:xanthine dehydrogenase family protein molybdopterin-binding subunit [Acuticoccus kandeliae]|uniref:xanthine dehydrogenase family protein molybdopterin-binding subunit n=1 Tax=Acuticoccus kandeliae TaxID=2073160 RepID=UPI000D3E0EED|nr:xanthine dehydrogenase family protein molybdopterin-binding subunit [Acuticoccus kandeliae]